MKMSDEDLINQIKDHEHCSSAMREIIDRHSGIYLSMVHQYISNDTHSSLKNDVLSDKDFFIYQTVLKYNPSKNTKFSTFLGNETKWMCLNTNNKKKNKNLLYLEDEKLDFFNNCEIDDSIDRDIFNKIIDFSKNHPDKRVAKIFDMRYIEGKDNNVMPWRMISNELRMSIQGVINIHNSAIENFKHKLEREEVVKC